MEEISIWVICIIVYFLGNDLQGVRGSPIQTNIAARDTGSPPGYEDNFKREEILDDNYFVEWAVDFEKRQINFTVIVGTLGFVGFGLSYTGGMTNADMIIGGVYDNEFLYFSDYHGIGNQQPIRDDSQDWYLLGGSENATHTTLTFTRKLDTCDAENDILIGEDTLKIIWSYGETDDLNFHGRNRGSLHVNLLDPVVPVHDLNKYQVWTTAQPVTLPGDDTTYWCTFFKGPVSNRKHHVVGFDIFLNGTIAKQHTHHADLYRCVPPRGETADEFFGQFLGYGYDCYFDTRYFPVEHCQLFELQWSIGGKVTVFPDFVGLPIGEIPENEYFMTEIHYDNPDKIENLEIHSGMQMYYTKDLRGIDAGFLQVGSMTSKLYSTTVPPNSDNFVMPFHCPSECTSHIPEDGINVFIYLMHSHLSGRVQKIRHFRDAIELPPIADDQHYDFNYQNNRMLLNEVKIFPNDHITLECTYETKWKLHGNVTLGGRSPREEMCQTFLMYYPRFMEVNQCGSYFPQLQMLGFMGIQNVTSEPGIIDPTVLLPPHLQGMKYSQVVEAMDWNIERRQEFQNMIRFNPQQAYCLPHHEDEHDAGSYVFTQYPKDFVEYVKESDCTD